MRLDTRAFARAAGLIGGIGMLLVTLVALVFGPADGPAFVAGLLPGYSVSFVGAIVGAGWGLAYGYVFGAAFAFTYNIAIVPPAPPPFEWNPETQAKDS